MMRKFILVLAVLAGTFSVAAGQIERNKNSIFRVDRTELGLGLGTTFYFGDFNEYVPFASPRYYGTVMHRFYFNMLYALRTSIAFANVAGSTRNYSGEMPYYDMKYPYGRPTINFSRNLIDLNTGIEIGFRPIEPALHRLDQKFAPYIFIGVGVMIAYPDSEAKTDEARSASVMYPRVYGTHEANAGSIQLLHIPIGLGFKYSPWHRWTIAGEWQFKKTFNDDFDRFNNVNPSELNNSKKGSLLLNTDWVSYFGVSISYRLAVGNDMKCYSMRRATFKKEMVKGKHSSYEDKKSGKIKKPKRK